MASYHLCIKSGKKGKAVNHAAYITREGKHSKEEDESDLITKSHGNLPEWANNNPIEFWRAADKYERANGAAYREYTLALPRELTDDQRLAVLEEFIDTEIGNKPYQYAIHAPVAALGDIEQPHAHLMFSDRVSDGLERPAQQHFKRFNPAKPELGGCKKDSGGKDKAILKETLIATRANLASIQNTALEQAGHDSRVDHRSNKARGIDVKPEVHLGHLIIKKMSAEEKKSYNDSRKNYFLKSTSFREELTS